MYLRPLPHGKFDLIEPGERRANAPEGWYTPVEYVRADRVHTDDDFWHHTGKAPDGPSFGYDERGNPFYHPAPRTWSVTVCECGHLFCPEHHSPKPPDGHQKAEVITVVELPPTGAGSESPLSEQSTRRTGRDLP